MQAFSELYNLLDQTNSTNEKVNLLADYFRETPPENSIWALALLCGRRPKRTVNSGLLRTWAAELAGITVSLWLLSRVSSHQSKS